MNNLGNDIEIAIVEKFRRGETSAMDWLYAAYANYLTGVCCRYIVHDDDLKDVLQESFIKIFTRMNSFNYRGKGSLRAWVTKIAINECLL